MRLKKLLTCFFVFLILKSNACLNIFALDAKGRVHYLEHSFFFHLDFEKKEIQKDIKHLEKKFKKGNFDFKNISDYGAYLLMSGYYKEGLELFSALIQKHSDVYEIRSNIAVAYELNGRFDSAYFWEKKALELNPDAHDKSEWIHLNILEARIKSAADTNWCLNHSITGIVDSINKHYQFSIHEGGKEMWLFENFNKQLDERFPFTYPEDKVMGKLMMELGDAYQNVSVYRSYYCYAIAKYLYTQLAKAVDEKMDVIKNNYPKKTVSDGEFTITLPDRTKKGYTREMLLPDEEDVRSFIDKLNFRTSLNPSIIKSADINFLISKI
jgi:tetratricopeptide (TPR) repeat protein